MTDRPIAGFDIALAPLDGAAGVAVRGDVDLAVTLELERALDDAIRDSAGAFVLDLCDVEMLDSGGLRVLLHARALLAREDRDLAVVCPAGPVRRLFEVVGIEDLLCLYASRRDAAAALVPAGSQQPDTGREAGPDDGHRPPTSTHDRSHHGL